MKRLIFCWLLTGLFFSGYAQYDADRTGYEGDFFSLEGALDLFKESSTLREFERKINSEEYWVNNLDLNYDGRIDYVRVEHRQQGNFHAIVLQALVGRYEVQDVAVIEIDVIGRGEAVLQIIGDEDLYGDEVIVEPVEGYSDTRRGYHTDYGDYVNVYYWPVVQYILGRDYHVYASPYYWHYYPTWWAPRVQVTWVVFRPRIVIYLRAFHVVHRNRVIRVHNFYRPQRSYCDAVVRRSNEVRVSHGRPAVHREPSAYQRERGHNERDAVERQRTTARSNATEEGPTPLSRKRTESSDTRRSTPGTDQRDRGSVGRPESSRSTAPRQDPSLSRNRTESSDGRSDTRRSTPGTDQRDRSSVGRPESSRSTAPRQDPSLSRSRTQTDGGRSDSGRSASQNNQGNRSAVDRTETPRARTSTRSASPTRQPSADSGKSAPATTRSKANGDSAPKRGNTSSSSRSRKGGNE
ncbi:MAG TPA: hypothetical protein PKE06_00245 [Flavilitoribacter sp.]|nr:hypothetical protein [Flavilitoribacter sp.]HMQ86553.1 hypothetical protein [Flavilitoribacter sp.]